MAYSRHSPLYQTADERKDDSTDVNSYLQNDNKDSYREETGNSISFRGEVYPSNSKFLRADELYRSNSKDLLCPVENNSKKRFKYSSNDGNPNEYGATNSGFSERDYGESDEKIMKPSGRFVGRGGFFQEEHLKSSVHNKRRSRQTGEYHSSGRHMYDTGISYSSNAGNRSRVDDETRYKNNEDKRFVLKNRGNQIQDKQSPSQPVEMEQYDNFKYAAKHPWEYNYRSGDESQRNHGHPSDFSCNPSKEARSSRRHKEDESGFYSGTDSSNFIPSREEAHSARRHKEGESGFYNGTHFSDFIPSGTEETHFPRRYKEAESKLCSGRASSDFRPSRTEVHSPKKYKEAESKLYSEQDSSDFLPPRTEVHSPRRYKEAESKFYSGRDSSDFIPSKAHNRRNNAVEHHSKDSSEEWFPVEEFQTISSMVHKKYNTEKYATMKDAEKIARIVGFNSGCRNLGDESHNHELFNSESIRQECSQPQKRIFWAKLHKDRSNSATVMKSGGNRKNLFQENSVPAKGKSVWQAKKDKAKGKIKESLKEFFSKLQVWSTSLKFIEGHFGTSVVSYFVFLRWLLFLNLYIFIIFLVFIVLPQVYFPALQHRKNITTAPTTEVIDSDFISQVLGTRKLLAEYEPRVSPPSYLDLFTKHSSLDSDRLKDLGSLFDTYVGPKFLDVALNYGRTNYTAEVRHNFSEYCDEKYKEMVKQNTSYSVASVIQDFFQGTGWMERTLMFTGYYLPTDLLVSGTDLYYNLPVAFLGVLFALYIICLIKMINYASKGVRENLLSTEVGVQSYCNMVFCGWDYCIENARTANLKHRSILLELKGNLAEVRRQQEVAQWTTLHKTKVYLIRSIVNIVVVASLVGTYYLIYYVAQIQLREQSVQKHQGFSELLIQFLPSITITAVNFILPVIFDILVRYESYGIQAALNTTLVRIIFVRLASIIILVITFHRQIACEPKDMCFIGKEGCSSPICWETHVGQQMYRLVLMDFFVVIAVTFIWEVPRNFIVQRWKCKLTEMVGRQTFDVPSQVLAIVYGQTLCWLGVFYSPLLPAVCVLKIIILFYLKKFTLIVNCVPSQLSYRASRSNAVFVIVLMLNFFISVAILGYSVTNIAPSPACSPFRHLNYMVDAIREALNTWSPYVTEVLKYIFSTGFAIATIIFLGLAIYYYLTVTAAHKRMIKVLKSQLVLEGRDKQFLLKRLTEVACEGMAKDN